MVESQLKALAKTKGRSRLSNGHVLPKPTDGRTIWARRFRDLLILHVNELGGADLASEAEKAIVRRACTLIVELERMEAKFAMKGGAKEWELLAYQRASNTLRRLLESVGLQRRSRDITLTVDEYLQQQNEDAAP
jgi:hypothetical protein